MISLLQGLSPRLRLLLALACAVVPFATVLLFASLWVYRPLQDDVDLLSDAIQARFEEVSTLQLLLLRSAMPPNDYLLHGREDERIRFGLISGRVETLLKALEHGTEGRKAVELHRVAEMQRRWAIAREMGESLLYWPPATRLTEGVAAMERFDGEIEQLAEAAESLLAHARAELDDARARAIGRRHDLNRFVALSTSVAGILTMILIAYLGRALQGSPLGSGRNGFGRSSDRMRPARAPARTAPSADEAGADEPGAADEQAGAPTAAIDTLTGLWSQRSLHQQLAIETERAMVLETPSSLAIVSIDHSPEVTGAPGAGVADALLVAVAERIRHVIRQTDFPARSGSAEFSVLMPATDLARASEVAERIRAHVAERPIAAGGRAISATVSIGVAGDALASSGQAGASTLLGRADQALHRARRAGGDRVECSGTPHR